MALAPTATPASAKRRDQLSTTAARSQSGEAVGSKTTSGITAHTNARHSAKADEGAARAEQKEADAAMVENMPQTYLSRRQIAAAIRGSKP